MKRKNKEILSVVVVWVAILVIFGVFNKGGGTESFVQIEKEGFTLRSVTGESLKVNWEEIQNVEKRDSVDFGTVVSGTDTADQKSGTFHNDEFGDYRLFADPDISNYLIITTDETTLVMNYESEKSTDSFYDALLKQVETTTESAG